MEKRNHQKIWTCGPVRMLCFLIALAGVEFLGDQVLLKPFSSTLKQTDEPTKNFPTSPSAIPKVEDSSSTSTSTSPSSTPRRNIGLTIWTDKPLNIRSPLVFARKNPKHELQERLWNVEFKVCNSTTIANSSDDNPCPMVAGELPPTKNNNNATGMQSHHHNHNHHHPAYQENLDQTLMVYENRTGTIRPWPRSFFITQFVSVTYWDEALKSHVPLNYTDRIHVNDCTENCPQSCPNNNHKDKDKDKQDYPYFWDVKDSLCKSTDPEAFPPKRPYGGQCSCETTCFTPESGQHNSSWPWKSQSQRESFYPPVSKKEQEEQAQKRQSCIEERRSAVPYSYRFACNSTEPLPCPACGDVEGRLMFMPESKLILCGIPKVGITEWIKFFRYTFGAKDYLSLPHYKKDRLNFTMWELSMNKAQELLNDPAWTRAVFFREPAERLLSAYLDKIVASAYTQKAFHVGSLDDNPRKVLTFSEFIELVAWNNHTGDCSDPRGLHSCTDPHWKPQVMSCGLDHSLPLYDFVGSFDQLAQHTKLLLERVGLWDKFGAVFDDGKNRINGKEHFVCMIPPPVSNETVPGFNQRGVSGAGKNVHSTGSKSKFDEYYTPELLATVRKVYALDYAIWDELQKLPADKVASGRDLQNVKDFCASKE